MDQLVKCKQTLIYEILFALEGIGGDLLVMSGKTLRVNECVVECGLLSAPQLHLLDHLCVIANEYAFARAFVDRFGAHVCRERRAVAHAVRHALLAYRSDLKRVEYDVLQYPDYSIMKFNAFLKYKQMFAFIREMIKNCAISWDFDLLESYSLSGWRDVRQSAQQMLDNVLLYSHIWNWIAFAYKSEKKCQFFISGDESESALDVSRLPSFISAIDAKRILEIGNSVRIARRRADHRLSDHNLIDLYATYAHIKNDKYLFASFVESISATISRHSFNYVVNDQNLLKHLNVIKSVYLTGEETVWLYFLSHSSNVSLNDSRLKHLFECSLRQITNANLVHNVLTTLSISSERRDGDNTCVRVFLTYDMPSPLQSIINNSSFDKYNYILNFLLSIYSSRLKLNQIWFNSHEIKCNALKSSEHNKSIWFLRHMLSNIIDAIYYFVKVDVIQFLYNDLMHKINDFQHIEVIDKEHQTFINCIIAQLFLKTNVIRNCIEELLLSADRLENCVLCEHLIENLRLQLFRSTSQLYHLLANMETRKISPMVNNLVSQLDICLKYYNNF